MSGALMQSVVFFVLVVLCDSLEDNQHTRKMHVICPINEKFKETGFFIYGSKEGDNTDPDLVYACNWPNGKDGEEDCQDYYGAFRQYLSERGVDVTVPTNVFRSNSTFECRFNGHTDRCIVLDYTEEADDTTSTPPTATTTTGGRGSNPSGDRNKQPSDAHTRCSAADRDVLFIIITSVMMGTLVAILFICFCLVFLRQAKEEAKVLLKKIMCSPRKHPMTVVATTVEGEKMMRGVNQSV